MAAGKIKNPVFRSYIHENEAIGCRKNAMLVEIKDGLNDLDISLSLITKVIEEKTTVSPNYKTFVVVYFDRGETATLKGWTLDQWRKFFKERSAEVFPY